MFKTTKTWFLCLVFSLAFNAIGYSQTTFNFKYSYDKAGNRVKRVFVLGTAKPNAARLDNSDIDPAQSEIITYSNAELSIYPNPVVNKLILQVKTTDTALKSNFTIYTLDGQTVIRTVTFVQTTEVDFSQQPLGVYVLRYSDGKNTTDWKIVKE